MKIYHNPRCRKSRETRTLLKENGIDPEIILYLNQPPDRKELEQIIQRLGIRPQELIRKGEKIYKENFKGKIMDDSEWIDIMIKYPKLIERPIVLKEDQAVIGRPPEKVLDLIA